MLATSLRPFMVLFCLGCLASKVTSQTVAQQAYLKASNTDAGDLFGWSVSVSGNTVVVGAPWESSNSTGVNGTESDNSAPASGAAYVFVRTSSGWIQEAYLKASTTEAGDLFGWAVSISGETIIVGARGEDSNATGVNGDESDNSASGSGAAYVFTRTGTTWSQGAYLKASNSGALDEFGSAVSASGDRVVVGAWAEDSNATGVNGSGGNDLAPASGAAYVFVRSGTTWIQEAYLKASNTGTGFPFGDRFGGSVSIFGDTALVGADEEDSGSVGVNGDENNNLANNSGAAYVFVHDGTAWSQQAYLKASNTEAIDLFGSSVSLSGDTAVVGASGEDSSATGIGGNESDNSASSSGAAYVFTRDGPIWVQEAYVKASNPETGDSFSWVSVYGDMLVVGAQNEGSSATGVNGDESDNSARVSGAAYVFVRNATSWSQEAYLKASNTDSNDRFGNEVAVAGNTVLVAAQIEASNATGVNGNGSDNSAADSGAAYAFELSPFLATDWDQISLSAGGAQTLSLYAGMENASALYWILTTTTGTSPGLALPPSPLVLPLNFSSFLLFTIINPNLIVVNSLDVLDGNGEATATMALPPGLDSGLAGITFHHAYFLVELVGLTATAVSNAVPLTLIP